MITSRHTDTTPEWLSVREASKLHHQLTGRRKQIHYSAVYRWIYQGSVLGEKRGTDVFVSRDSLAEFCRPKPGKRKDRPRPSMDQRGRDARERILCSNTPGVSPSVESKP